MNMKEILASFVYLDKLDTAHISKVDRNVIRDLKKACDKFTSLEPVPARSRQSYQEPEPTSCLKQSAVQTIMSIGTKTLFKRNVAFVLIRIPGKTWILFNIKTLAMTEAQDIGELKLGFDLNPDENYISIFPQASEDDEEEDEWDDEEDDEEDDDCPVPRYAFRLYGLAEVTKNVKESKDAYMVDRLLSLYPNVAQLLRDEK